MSDLIQDVEKVVEEAPAVENGLLARFHQMSEMYQAEKGAIVAHLNQAMQNGINLHTSVNLLQNKIQQLLNHLAANKIAPPPGFVNPVPAPVAAAVAAPSDVATANPVTAPVAENEVDAPAA